MATTHNLFVEFVQVMNNGDTYNINIDDESIHISKLDPTTKEYGDWVGVDYEELYRLLNEVE